MILKTTTSQTVKCKVCGRHIAKGGRNQYTRLCGDVCKSIHEIMGNASQGYFEAEKRILKALKENANGS
jgi:phage FluMu protein Com